MSSPQQLLTHSIASRIVLSNSKIALMGEGCTIRKRIVGVVGQQWQFEIIMQGSQSQYLSITTNKVPRRSPNVYQMLVFEWILLVYYLYMFSSVVLYEQYQSRMLLYCIIFLLFDKLDLTYKYLELEDPLHLCTTINCIRYLSFLCIFNLMFLLVRLVIQYHNLHAFIMMIHFLLIMVLFLHEFSKKNTKLDINVDSNNIFSKFITPLLLFTLNKTCQVQYHQFWLAQLMIFALNLFISAELNRILLMKECYYFGWKIFPQKKEKDKLLWNKKRALKAMIITCCIVIVIQNLMLISQRIKFEISVTIIHSFLVTIMAYLLYLNYLPNK